MQTLVPWSRIQSSQTALGMKVAFGGAEKKGKRKTDSEEYWSFWKFMSVIPVIIVVRLRNAAPASSPVRGWKTIKVKDWLGFYHLAADGNGLCRVRRHCEISYRFLLNRSTRMCDKCGSFCWEGKSYSNGFILTNVREIISSPKMISVLCIVWCVYYPFGEFHGQTEKSLTSM